MNLIYITSRWTSSHWPNKCRPVSSEPIQRAVPVKRPLHSIAHYIRCIDANDYNTSKLVREIEV